MTVSDDPAARRHGPGSPSSVSPALERTSEMPVDGHAARGNGVGTTNPGSWQQELVRRLVLRPVRGVIAGLLVGLLFGLIAGDYMVQGTTTYTSQTVVLLDNPLGIATAGDAGTLIKLSELRYKYASLASTDAIAQPVAATLHVPVGVVLGSASVQVPANSLLLVVQGTWTTPVFAQALSKAMAQDIIQYINTENSAYNIPASNQVIASIVNPAVGAVPSHPSATRGIAVGLVVFVGTALIAFAVYQLVVADPNRRRPS